VVDWVGDMCTLPAAERPLRVAEFDGLFAAALREVRRVTPTRLRLVLAAGGGAEERARDLAARESACCSFFTFAITRRGDALWMEVGVPAAQVAVLDGLAARAAAAVGVAP
jgi:hypothetical protein